MGPYIPSIPGTLLVVWSPWRGHDAELLDDTLWTEDAMTSELSHRILPIVHHVTTG